MQRPITCVASQKACRKKRRRPLQTTPRKCGVSFCYNSKVRRSPEHEANRLKALPRGADHYSYGRAVPKETKEKIAAGVRKYFQNVANRKRVSEALQNSPLLRRGKQSNFWKGGISLPAHKLELNSKRKLLERTALGSHTNAEWQTLKEKCGFACVSCHKREPEIRLTVDHIQPLSKGGTHDISNIQPLCRRCNSRKRTNIINYLPLYEAIAA